MRGFDRGSLEAGDCPWEGAALLSGGTARFGDGCGCLLDGPLEGAFVSMGVGRHGEALFGGHFRCGGAFCTIFLLVVFGVRYTYILSFWVRHTTGRVFHCLSFILCTYFIAITTLVHRQHIIHTGSPSNMQGEYLTALQLLYKAIMTQPRIRAVREHNQVDYRIRYR